VALQGCCNSVAVIDLCRKDTSALVTYGADEETRTPDPRITNALLYQLSYIGTPMVRLNGQGESCKVKTASCSSFGGLSIYLFLEPTEVD
jgi:hypothetical protein